MRQNKIEASEQIPVNVVGSSTFGRYPKISVEKTYNMFISDEWLVNYAGFKGAAVILSSGEGRGLFHSIRGNFMIAVVSSSVYRLSTTLVPVFLGTLETSTGEVVMDENLNQQIAITDGRNLYIYSYNTNNLTKQTLSYTPAVGSPYDIVPNYVTYHNSFFLIGSDPTSTNPQLWYAATFATDDTIAIATQDAFPLQTKPDYALAVIRIPGRGNNVLVFGSAVAEVWTQVGGTENYRRVQSFNIDQGCVSIATIAASEEFVAWLGQNQNNAPSIMVTDGSSVRRISSDGIDYLMQNIERPDQSTAFFFRQDGHLFYQITFYNPADNLSLIYDFNSQKFFHVSDEHLNYHPARQVAYFNERSYFVSLNTGTLYDMSTDYVTYNYTLTTENPGAIIPRIRICKTVRKSDNTIFRVGYFTFWIEQGVNDFVLINNGNNCDGLIITEDVGDFIITEGGDMMLVETGSCGGTLVERPRVDMSFSKNGNQSFSNVVGREINQMGHYRNRMNWYRMGFCNEFTPQLRFWGFQRFVAQDGVLEVY